MAAFWMIDNQFQKFIDWQYFMDYDSQMTEKFFAEYTRIKVTQFRETLLQHMGNVKKSVAKRAHHQRQYERRVSNRQMQTQEKSGMHDTSSSLGNYITHVVDANIRPVNDQVPFVEVQLTAQHNVLAIEQQHTDQSKPIYDTYLLEKVDSNTSLGSTNMSHRGGEIDQDAEHDQVNSRAKVQSPKTININKPIEPKSHTQKPDRQIAIGQRFSLNKSSTMHEKPNTPRSCLRWIPTVIIFKTAGLRWIPTGNMLIDSTTKFDSEPLNDSNDDITNPYECKQSLDVCAGTLNLSAVQASDLNVNKMASADNTSSPAFQRKERCTLQFALHLEEEKSSCLRPFSSTSFMLFHALLTTVAAPKAVDPASSPSSTTINQDVPSASSSPTTQEIQSQVTHQDDEEQIYGHQNAQFDNAPLLHNLSLDLSFEETTVQGFISSNLHHINQSFDSLTKLTMNHPL
nr:hypothetical protein [Tanacetum cinerariifolium]